MSTELKSFIEKFKQQEKVVTNFKNQVRNLLIKNSLIKIFINAYVQSEDSDVALAGKIATIINNGWLVKDQGDKLPDNWLEGFDYTTDDNIAQLHFFQRIDDDYKAQTLIIQFKDNVITSVSYTEGFTLTTPHSKGKFTQEISYETFKSHFTLSRRCYSLSSIS